MGGFTLLATHVWVAQNCLEREVGNTGSRYLEYLTPFLVIVRRSEGAAQPKGIELKQNDRKNTMGGIHGSLEQVIMPFGTLSLYESVHFVPKQRTVVQSY